MEISSFQFSSKEKNVILHLGEMILGISKQELGDEFLEEATLFVGNLEDFLISDLTRLINLFNTRLLSFLFVFSIKPFTKMSIEVKEKYYDKWVKSKIGLLRTGASTLRALCGWSYYSLQKSWEELNYPGKTIGRENETPTLLEGKEKWKEGMEVP